MLGLALKVILTVVRQLAKVANTPALGNIG